MPLWPLALMWVSLALLPFALYLRHKADREVERWERTRDAIDRTRLRIVSNEGAPVYRIGRRVG